MSAPRPASRLFRLIARHPWSVLIVACLLSLAALYYTSQKMEFLTGRDDLMPRNAPFQKDYRDYRTAFGDQEEIVVVVESDDPALTTRFCDTLYGRLSQEQHLFVDLLYPGGLPYFRQNGLLFMPLNELQTMAHTLQMAAPVLKDLAAAPSVQTLFNSLSNQIDAYLKAPDPQKLQRLTFMLGTLDKGFAGFNGQNSTLSMDAFLKGSDSGKPSMLENAGKQQIIAIWPLKDPNSFMPSEKAIKKVRAELTALRNRPEFKGVTAGLTGVPVLEYEEMATSQHDMGKATLLSLTLTVILLLVAFRGWLNTLAAMVSLVVGICVSFGFATLTVGHLNILTMAFAIMLIGLGIEYGIQVVLRYQEELGRGLPQLEAIEQGLAGNLRAVTLAAATVALAFATFAFTDFKGIAELGIIAAGGVAICVLVTFTVLPAMLVLLSRHRKPRRPKEVRPRPHFRTVSMILFGHPKVVIAATALCCLASLYPLSRISFDYNLMNLQAKGLESVTYAYKLMRSKENAGYFAVVVANTPAEAAAKTRALEALPTVDHVVSINSFVPDRQPEKLAELAAIKAELADVKPAQYEGELSLMELPSVFENFRNSVVKLKAKLEERHLPEAKEAGNFLAILDAFFARLDKERNRNAVGMLQDFQGGMFSDFPQKIELLKESLNARPLTEADIPPQLRARFVGKTGKLMLQVAPKHEIFDYKPLRAFLHDVRSVDPHATGEPVMVYESMTIMRDAYRDAFVYAFCAIVVILLVAFRSLKFALIGLVPLVVGILFMVSGMYLFGISFNSANIIVMPLVLGIAVDSGIYIINRFRREDESAATVVTSSTGVGVLLNTLTIMASFGALMVAHHQGVFSIGAVMSLGMVACQVAFMITLPAVLTLARKR